MSAQQQLWKIFRNERVKFFFHLQSQQNVLVALQTTEKMLVNKQKKTNNAILYDQLNMLANV